MKAFNKIFVVVIVAIFSIVIITNVILATDEPKNGRPYLVEITRIARKIEDRIEINNLAECEYVTEIVRYGDTADFYTPDSDYVIREINGTLYRFSYTTHNGEEKTKLTRTVNFFLGIMTALIMGVMLYIQQKILRPFEQLTNIPYELSKGNLTTPVKETKNRFFGRFLWGVDMLRENMEQQKEHELQLQREKKMLLLSLSHDIKTPLSSIKLYSKALSKGLYTTHEKQVEIADSINAKADEIECYVSEIITASREDFLSLNVTMGEFYLAELVKKIKSYYMEKLSLIKIDFTVGNYKNCLINGDIDRSIEVVQNIIENAVKYGDGKSIDVRFSEEESCLLLTVSNSGCTLPATDLPHIFESFWRGSNTGAEKGSGLGLYICRQLMHKMNGELYADITDGFMCVTAVFGKV